MNHPDGLYSDYSTPATKSDVAKVTSLDYAQILNSLAFLTDEQRAGFFALLGASYCLKCGSTEGSKCVCQRDE